MIDKVKIPLITDEQSLVGATCGKDDLRVYDDGFGDIYVCFDNCGHFVYVLGLVRASSWEDAYDICEDEFFLESDETVEDLIKEYGEDWMNHDGFNETYGFRPNGPNTRDKVNHGIYYKIYDIQPLHKLTAETMAEQEIKLKIEDEEE